jgi:hypothetical protein
MCNDVYNIFQDIRQFNSNYMKWKERCYIQKKKLLVSAYNGHRQVSVPIKGSLYI